MSNRHKRDLIFISNLLTDFCVAWSKEALRKQKLKQKRIQSLGVDWDEVHNWGLYWEDIEFKLSVRT
jgi:hypothetical protein